MCRIDDMHVRHRRLVFSPYFILQSSLYAFCCCFSLVLSTAYSLHQCQKMYKACTVLLDHHLPPSCVRSTLTARASLPSSRHLCSAYATQRRPGQPAEAQPPAIGNPAHHQQHSCTECKTTEACRHRLSGAGVAGSPG